MAAPSGMCRRTGSWIASSRVRSRFIYRSRSGSPRRFTTLRRDREHDLAELLTGLEALVGRTDLGQRHDLVDDRARAPARDQLVGALKVGLRAHRRAENRQLLPPDAVQRSGRVWS